MPTANNPARVIPGSFNLPFAEQIDFFRKKLARDTDRWDDIRPHEHNSTFIVAGAKGDILVDLMTAVDKAAAKGTGLEEFRKDFWKTVADKGWHGWTGEGTRQGEAWRTKVIWETNLRTSYMAGRHAQLTDPDLLKIAPYWRYVHSESVLHPRPEHLAWNGLVLPHDHPFWQTHFPPNGWGCACRVVAETKPRDGDKTAPPEGWNVISEKTGTPAGIDKGWAYAPGASNDDALRRMIEQKANGYPEPLKEAFLAEVGAVVGEVVGKATPLSSLDDFIGAGKKITDALPTEQEKMWAALKLRLKDDVGTGVTAEVPGKNQAAKWVRLASEEYPASWVEAANNYGTLHAKLDTQGRGFYHPGKNTGYIVAGNQFVAIHEYAHRLQEAMPELQAKFVELHQRRTQGDALESLKKLEPSKSYGVDEMTRQDHYINPYWGREYNGEPLEVMTMAMQTVLTGDKLEKLYNEDREMFDFVVGLLFHWKP